MKLVNGQLIRVFIGVMLYEIAATANEFAIADFHDETRTLPSNAKEFAKAMSRAQYEITKND